MPLCNEHGQVYGEGGQCIVCAGGVPTHDPDPKPLALTQEEKDVYERAIEQLNHRVTALEEQFVAASVSSDDSILDGDTKKSKSKK